MILRREHAYPRLCLVAASPFLALLRKPAHRDMTPINSASVVKSTSAAPNP
jgi:hypothetical protein